MIIFFIGTQNFELFFRKLQPLPVCANNAFAPAVDAGSVSEFAAAVAGGAHFDTIALMALRDFVYRRVRV